MNWIAQLLEQFAHAQENTVAFAIYDGQHTKDVDYRTFVGDVLRAAGYLRQNGIQGQHIALAAQNSYEWLAVFLGVIASGNVAVLLNPALPADMIAQQCAQADASCIWCDEAVASSLPKLNTCEMLAAQPMALADAAHIGMEDTILLLGTSGTTGKSKMVEITSRNLYSSVVSSEAYSAGKERCLLVMPLYHVGGVAIVFMILKTMKTLCIGQGMPYILADMPVLNPTFVPLVPAVTESLERILRRVADPSMRARFIGTQLKRVFVGGAAPKVSTCQYFASQGITMETGYSMTESTGCGMCCELDETNIGAIGKLRDGVQCRIEDGEILLKGPVVMKGYYKDPEETAKVIVDGWLHTGDMGYCDENGYYFVTGRKKNVIILSGGENVNPEEIEAAFGQCPSILECMVYSDGKGICADVYTENEEEARAFIRQYNKGMPLYRQVYKVSCSADPLEKTATGKIKRKENK